MWKTFQDNFVFFHNFFHTHILYIRVLSFNLVYLFLFHLLHNSLSILYSSDWVTLLCDLLMLSAFSLAVSSTFRFSFHFLSFLFLLQSTCYLRLMEKDKFLLKYLVNFFKFMVYLRCYFDHFTHVHKTYIFLWGTVYSSLIQSNSCKSSSRGWSQCSSGIQCKMGSEIEAWVSVCGLINEVHKFLQHETSARV